jgi:hypothetical protein
MANNKTQKRDRSTGKFARFYCNECEDEGSVGCGACQGSGIGAYGPIETSKCSSCGGSGCVPCGCQADNEPYEPDYDDDYGHLRARRRDELRIGRDD